MRLTDFQGKPNTNTAAAQVGPLTVDGTARKLTSLITLHDATQFVVISTETAPLRLTVDGRTDPTATLGFRYPAGCEVVLSRGEAENARLIRETATSAAIQVAQFVA